MPSTSFRRAGDVTSDVNCCPPDLPDLFFQQDSAPAYTARITQDCLRVTCPDFIAKDQWPTEFGEAMLEACQ